MRTFFEIVAGVLLLAFAAGWVAVAGCTPVETAALAVLVS